MEELFDLRNSLVDAAKAVYGGRSPWNAWAYASAQRVWQAKVEVFRTFVPVLPSRRQFGAMLWASVIWLLLRLAEAVRLALDTTIELLIGQIIAGSARPDWTLLALSSPAFKRRWSWRCNP